MQSEKQIEARLRERVKNNGGLALKFVSPGCRGVPDRLIFLPGGRIFLVELKKPGGKLTLLQEKMKKKFEDMGFKFYVIDSYELVEEFINEVSTT
jgi:hypothetical protein